MPNLQELLKNAQVEWKTLGEIGEIQMCKRIFKKQTKEVGDVPFYKIGTFGKSPDAFISEELFREYKAKYNYPKKGEVLISASGTIGKTVIFNGEDAYFQDSNIIWISHDESLVLNKYLYYFYQIAKWPQSEGGTINRLYNYNLINLQIPIPSLEVQAEIVRILDTFAELTVELTAELTLRKKQYRYYLEKLLSEEYLRECSEKVGEEVRVVKLGEIGEIQMCKRIFKKQTKEVGDVPFYKIGTFGKSPDAFISEELFREYKAKYNYPKKGEVLISASGTIGRTVIFDGEDAYFQDSNIIWISHDENLVLNKYLYYFYQIVKWPQSEGGTINRLYNYNLINLQIPLPPLSVQSHIVGILEKFEHMVQEVSGLLPQEIALRKKQYEYYREKLLSFNLSWPRMRQ